MAPLKKKTEYTYEHEESWIISGEAFCLNPDGFQLGDARAEVGW